MKMKMYTLIGLFSRRLELPAKTPTHAQLGQGPKKPTLPCVPSLPHFYYTSTSKFSPAFPLATLPLLPHFFPSLAFPRSSPTGMALITNLASPGGTKRRRCTGTGVCGSTYGEGAGLEIGGAGGGGAERATGTRGRKAGEGKT